MDLLAATFEGIIAGGRENGAAVAVFKDGSESVSLCGGGFQPPVPTESSGFRGGGFQPPEFKATTVGDRRHEWRPDTLVPVWSATKGPAAFTLLFALELARMPIDAPVRRVWPKLGVDVTFAQLLTHQAGLAALDASVSVHDYDAVIAALERQPPNWPPATAHGYHPRTSGFLWDECVRRLTSGVTLGKLWRSEIASKWAIDVWIGLPDSEFHRVAAIHPGKAQPRPEEAEFARAFADRSSLTRRAFLSPRGVESISAMNSPEVWRAGFPGFGGVASAVGLARFYGLLASGSLPSHRCLTGPESQAQVDGFDLILRMPTAFAAGFQRDPIGPGGAKARRIFGPSPRAFGHPGAGGSLAFADPEHRLGFAYVMNRIDPGVMPNECARSLVEALYANVS